MFLIVMQSYAFLLNKEGCCDTYEHPAHCIMLISLSGYARAYECIE